MNTELSVLAWGCILGIVHIWAAVRVKTRQYGSKWNVGARDEALAPAEPIVGRLARALGGVGPVALPPVGPLALVGVLNPTLALTFVPAGHCPPSFARPLTTPYMRRASPFAWEALRRSRFSRRVTVRPPSSSSLP